MSEEVLCPAQHGDEEIMLKEVGNNKVAGNQVVWIGIRTRERRRVYRLRVKDGGPHFISHSLIESTNLSYVLQSMRRIYVDIQRTRKLAYRGRGRLTHKVKKFRSLSFAGGA